MWGPKGGKDIDVMIHLHLRTFAVQKLGTG